MAGMTAYVNFAGRYDQLIAQSRIAGAAAGAQAGGGITAGLGSALKKFALPAAVVGAGVGAFKLGESFNKAYNTIRVGTGKTGDALRGLEQDFKAVASQRPTGFNVAAEAITNLNQRLGITGKPLQDLSVQMLRLSGITKTEVGDNIQSVTRVFGDWGVSTGQQTGKLDALFRASQATGASVTQISDSMVKFGAPLRQLGFGFDQTAALVGKFEKEGVNTNLVMGSMRIALGKMARGGEPAQETLARVTDQIKNAGSASEANAIALELFGARAGPDMAAAIREGRFDLGELFDTVANGSDTIERAAKDTSTLGGKLGVLKNKILVGLEPIATGVYDAINNGMANVVEVAGPAASAIGEVFSVLFSGEFTGAGPFAEDSPFISGLFRARELIGDLLGWVGERLSAAWAWFRGIVGSVDWGAILGNLWDSAVAIVTGAINRIVWAWESVKFALSSGESNLTGWAGWLQDAALTAVGVLDSVTGAWDDLVAGFRGEGGEGPLATVGEKIRTVSDAVGGFVETVRNINWGDVWGNISGAVTSSAVGDWFGDLINQIRALDWEDVTGAIGDAFASTVEFLQPAFDAFKEMGGSLQELVTPVMDLVKALGTALAPVLRMVWPVLKTMGIALGVVAYVMHKAFVFQLKAAAAVVSWVANTIMPALTWVITNVVGPAISGFVDLWLWARDAVATAATWLWNTVLQPVFNLIVGYIQNVLLPQWQMIFTVVSTVFEGVWGAISFAWGIVQPIFSAIVGFIRDELSVRFNAFMWVASTVWSTVQTAIGAAWDFIKPKFDAIVSFVTDTLIPVWSRIAEAVGSAFRRVPDLIGDALRSAGNIVAGFLRGAAGIARGVSLDSIAAALERGAAAADRWGGLDITIPTGSTPSARPQGGAFAAGGYVPGPLSDMRDTVPAMLMPGEYVLTRAMVRQAGVGNLEAWRRGATGFADGGPVGVAGDIWDATGGKVVSTVADKLRAIGAGAVERVWPEMGGVNGLLGIIPGGINYVRRHVIDLIKGEAKKREEATFANVPGGGGPVVAGSNRALGKMMAAARGWTGAQWDALDRLWMGESGWRNTAQNPTSTAYGIAQFLDSTWAGYGIPKTSNPGLQIEAGMRYIAARYGTPLGAWNAWLSRSPHWYAQGGLVGNGVAVHGQSFDAGGILEPGWNLVKNMTGDKEALRPSPSGPLLHIDHAEFRDRTDADALAQGLSAHVMMGRM